MKRILYLIMTLLLAAMMLSACGSAGGEDAGTEGTETPSLDSLKTIGDLMALEEDESQYAVYEEGIVYAFKLGDTYYRAKADLPEETARAYFDIDMMEEDYEAQQEELLSPIEIGEIEDLSDQILSPEEREALVGRTGQDLKDAGWLSSGYNLETMEFWMFYGPFEYTVTFDGEVAEADYDSFDDEEDIKPLTVKSVEFSGLGDATYIEDEADAGL